LKNAKNIKKSVEYINRNLCNEIKLKDIAEKSFFSEFHFHRIFKKNMGMSVMNYVKEKRLEKAAYDLKFSNEKITDIAFKYQYNSEEGFSRAFKRIYQLNPSAYRKDYSKTKIKSATISSLAA
jgi:AraC family transcriptional regulator